VYFVVFIVAIICGE